MVNTIVIDYRHLDYDLAKKSSLKKEAFEPRPGTNKIIVPVKAMSTHSENSSPKDFAYPWDASMIAEVLKAQLKGTQ